MLTLWEAVGNVGVALVVFTRASTYVHIYSLYGSATL